MLVWAHPEESKNALGVVGGAWGAELRTITSREITTRSSCSSTVFIKLNCKVGGYPRSMCYARPTGLPLT